MAQIEKLEVQVDVKSSPERFYETYLRKNYLLPKLSPNEVRDAQLIKGEWDSVGSVIQYSFAPEGNASSHVDLLQIDAIDEEDKSITYTVLDGSEAKKYYKTCRMTVHALEKSEGGGSSVKVFIEYEKQNETIPAPTRYTEFANVVYKNIDAYIINNA
ncbi:Major latex protein domain containing protein [Trema orientale]|uniref:Major latex protein domain containing protein n=1 Tax=Trema orientale TaxID=63057 RepID=A0A2P5F9L8_TREOI|nr:Major latex protein domain containing protein [Trema orientale]